MIIYKGYRYANQQKFSYRCTHHYLSCKARAVLRADGVLRLNGCHNHGCDQDRLGNCKISQDRPSNYGSSHDRAGFF